MKYFLVFITVVALIAPVLMVRLPTSLVQNQSDCNVPNESYQECSDRVNECEPSCEDPNIREKPCTLLCAADCDCNFGYLRSSNGSCVLPSEC